MASLQLRLIRGAPDKVETGQTRTQTYSSAQMTKLQLDILVDGDKKQIGICLPDDERQVLERYVAFCGCLKCTILSGGVIEPISMDMHERQGIVLSANAPDRKDIAHALHELRPLVLQGESTYFATVKKIVSRRVEHTALRKYLKFLQRYYDFRPAETDPVPPQAGFSFGNAGDVFDTSERPV